MSYEWHLGWTIFSISLNDFSRHFNESWYNVNLFTNLIGLTWILKNLISDFMFGTSILMHSFNSILYHFKKSFYTPRYICNAGIVMFKRKDNKYILLLLVYFFTLLVICYQVLLLQFLSQCRFFYHICISNRQWTT